ncbi:MAG: BlaI/MecI/CopY family transcriptional regulator [Candidatus Zambryskibacteria bacterium]|nr:BlaI/MecI/CopY family transcriptional regulator [Candidatus Zambryskibacteria bacterium]
MLEKYLQNIGLTDKEATVYLSLVQVDNASVLDLSKKTKLKRPTVYVVLNSLAKKGLVSENTVGKKTHYQAEPPERLETFVERQKLVLDENSKRLKDIIPQIKGLERGSGERPIVKYYDGKEGIVSAVNGIFENDTETDEPIYLIYPRDLLDKLFPPEERNQYKNKRLQRKVKSKVLYSYENGEIPSDDMGERIKIDGKKYPITCDIAIYKDSVRISVLNKRFSSIYIKSDDVAETLRSLFRLIFDKLKETK